MLVIGNLSDTLRIRVLNADDADTKSAGSTAQPHLVQIPNFHTGHLGFVPGKTVLLTKPAWTEKPGHDDDRTCEFVVAPHAINQDILKVSCIFDEAQRVLERLVNLLSYLRVNIVKLESASSFESRHHVVHMVLDMAPSTLSTKPMTGGERSKFIDILPNLKITNRRGLELMLHIVSHCHQILTWKESPGTSGRFVPELYISEFDRHDWTGQDSRVSVDRGAVVYTRAREKPPGPRVGDPRATYFKLPTYQEQRIQTALGIDAGKPLNYLLLSDTDARSLRVQFFQDRHRRKIFEIGLTHKNEIGALYNILRMVADANFNIQSCLIREVEEYKNVWEAILEYQGPESALDDAPTDPREEIGKLLQDSVQKYQNDIAPYDIGVFIPSHLPDRTRFKEFGETGWTKARPLAPEAKGGRPCRPDLEPRFDQGPVERNWLITYANEILFENPKIFISCPSKTRYRKLLIDELERAGWKVSVYDDTAKMESTYTEARQLVADADYLVGIWVPDVPEKDRKGSAVASTITSNVETDHGDGADAAHPPSRSKAPAVVSISPWMHFELGQAVAFEREFKILSSSALPSIEVVRRIAADKPVFLFDESDDDAPFLERVKNLLVFMELNWRNGRKFPVVNPSPLAKPSKRKTSDAKRA